MKTQDEFVDLLNETYPALRELDPILFAEMYWCWVNSLEESVEPC